MKLKLAFSLVLSIVFYFSSSVPSFASSTFQVTVGDEQIMIASSSSLLDSPFVTVKTSGGIRAFSGNGPTYSFTGTNLNNLVQDTGINLDVEPASTWDNCTANISSIYIDPQNSNHWLAWYHAEGSTNCGSAPHIKSMAFAESNNAGATWINRAQVITGNETNFNGTTGDGEGDGKVIVFGGNFYMFYSKIYTTSAGTFSSAHIAKSPVISGGGPRTWQKYDNGNWTAGLDGTESAIPLPFGTSYVSYNSYLHKYILIITTGKWGFFLYETPANPSSENDLINGWTEIQTPMYPFVSFTTDIGVDLWSPDNWFNNDLDNHRYKSLYAYTSIINLDGDPTTSSQQFYIYYMKLFPGERFYSRNLMRRKITFNTSPSDPFDTKVDLVRYERTNPVKIRVSTEVAHPNEGYVKTQILGQMLPYQPDATKYRPVYECSIPGWKDYMLSIPNVSGTDPYPIVNFNNSIDATASGKWQHCESDGDQFIRTIGYAAISPTAPFTTPLYRCFDSTNTNHFASTDSGCEGKQNEFLIGYIQIINSNDINRDGKVDILDLARIVNARTQTTINPYSGPEDVNGDGQLNAQDLTDFFKNYTHL